MPDADEPIDPNGQSNPDNPEEAVNENPQVLPGSSNGGSSAAPDQDNPGGVEAGVPDAATPANPGTPPSPDPGPTTPAPQVFPADCKEIQATQAGATSGVYVIYLNPGDPAKRKALQAYCDMETDTGGWTLALNYVHKGKTNPNLSVRTTDLPLLGTDTLGTDESPALNFWGHAGNALMKNFAFTELRFFCRSSRVSNVINFVAKDTACLNTVRNGTGSCQNIGQNHRKLPGHTAGLPEATRIIAKTDGGDFAMTDTTFSSELTGNPDPLDPTWAIRGGTTSSWECDFGSNNADFDTIHRVFFR